jgi:hypothetical protein
MQIKSNLITAIVTALSVVALTWNPAADAVSPQSSSINVCVNKKSGAMRNASKCTKSERKIEMAKANVNLSLPTPSSVNQIPARTQVRSNLAQAELSIADLAGQSVQSVVSRITVPNFFGRDAPNGNPLWLQGPDCPSTAPIEISRAGYSSNYGMFNGNEFLNPDDDSSAGYLTLGKIAFQESSHPHSGDMDLYLLVLCAPILVAP